MNSFYLNHEDNTSYWPEFMKILLTRDVSLDRFFFSNRMSIKIILN